MKRFAVTTVLAATLFAAGAAAAAWLQSTMPVTVLGVGVQVAPAPFGSAYHIILPVRLPDGSAMTLSVYANRIE